jgi:hypothetical protein
MPPSSRRFDAIIGVPGHNAAREMLRDARRR